MGKPLTLRKIQGEEDIKRRRVEIKAIEDNCKRHTTFTKRRYGLFKKTKMLCDLSDAEAAVVVFSKAGNVFAFGHLDVNQVINRYISDPTSALANSDAGTGVEEHVLGDGGGMEMEEAAPPPLTMAEARIREALMENGPPAWDGMVRDLGLRQLGELEEAMGKIKSMVAERAREVEAAARRRFCGGEEARIAVA